jgi:hypothetical protein
MIKIDTCIKKFFVHTMKETVFISEISSMKFRVLWDVAPCSDVDRHFRGAYCLIIALMTEAVCTSETSINFNVITWRYIPEDSQLHLYLSK